MKTRLVYCKSKLKIFFCNTSYKYSIEAILMVQNLKYNGMNAILRLDINFLLHIFVNCFINYIYTINL